MRGTETGSQKDERNLPVASCQLELQVPVPGARCSASALWTLAPGPPLASPTPQPQQVQSPKPKQAQALNQLQLQAPGALALGLGLGLGHERGCCLAVGSWRLVRCHINSNTKQPGKWLGRNALGIKARRVGPRLLSPLPGSSGLLGGWNVWRLNFSSASTLMSC